MQDGYTQVGAGDSDMRVAGKDLQHHRQLRGADELHVPVRSIKQEREGGGPMKEHMESHHDHKRSGHHMRHHLEMEKERHEEAMEHHKSHLEKHHGRHHNSQHGHEHHSY